MRKKADSSNPLKKSCRGDLRHSSLFRKVILSFLVMSVIPAILMTIIANTLYSHSLYVKEDELIAQNVQQHSILIQERLKSIEDAYFELITNNRLIMLSKNINSDSERLYTADREEYQGLLESAAYSLKYVRAMAFLADNDQYVTYSRYYDHSGMPLWLSADTRKNIRTLLEEKNSLTISSVYNLLEGTNGYDPVILIGMPVFNLITGERSGVLVAAIGTDMLLQREGVTYDEGVETVVTDKNGMIITGTKKSAEGKELEAYLDTQYKGRNIHQITRECGDIDWTIHCIVDTDIELSSIRIFNVYVILLMLLITGIFFFITARFTGQYVTEIRNIGQAIAKYDADDSNTEKVHLKRDDELYMISHQFNRLIDRNNVLVETLRKKNEEIKEASERQKDAEIKALEAQINPHFLYNTLDSINWMAIDSGEEEISNMLGMLGSLLRYSVSNINIVVTLQAETEWVKKYVYLQRIRFNNSFDCLYQVTPEAMNFPVYKMLLQPLIENSILHAFEDTTSGGVMKVEAFVQEDGRLHISLEDNGCGMTEEQLEGLRNNILKARTLDSRSIGIGNVVNRLRIYYHDAADIQMTSTYGKGTKVTLIIPDRIHGQRNNDPCDEV